MKAIVASILVLSCALVSRAAVKPLSPLFSDRNATHVADLDQRQQGYFYAGMKTVDGGMEYPTIATAAIGENVQAPAQTPQSASLTSRCLGSACGGSWCLGSACYTSVCLGSACVGSGCFGSFCGTSVCAGGSGCVGSACTGSGCVTSICVGSVCRGSMCVGSACKKESCGGDSFPLVSACDATVAKDNVTLVLAVSKRCNLAGERVTASVKEGVVQSVVIPGAYREASFRSASDAGIDVTLTRTDGTLLRLTLRQS